MANRTWGRLSYPHGCVRLISLGSSPCLLKAEFGQPPPTPKQSPLSDIRVRQFA